MSLVGWVERLPLRSVWKHEAYDFTTWLQEDKNGMTGDLVEGLNAGL